MPRIVVGSDHARFRLKQHLVEVLKTGDHETLDLTTPFAGGRHARRVAQIMALEEES